MIRPARIDTKGAVIYKHRYKPFYNRFALVNDTQKTDQKLMITAIVKVFGIEALGDYGYEWTDYIEDYLDPELTSRGTRKLALVYFDHYAFIEYKGITIPIVGETDDASHRNKDYCEKKGYDFEYVQYKDQRKNLWASKSNTGLFRLPDNLSKSEKYDILINFFTKIKYDIENCS